MTVRTHYDNLHIEPNASAEEIRKAYRRLSKQYHPDLNQDPDAHRIMQLINQAYEVLSNPETRAEHDRWIAAQRAQTSVPTINIIIPANQQTAVTRTTPATASGSLKKNNPTKFSTMLAMLIACTLAIGLLGWQITRLIQQKHAAQLSTHEIPPAAISNETPTPPAASTTNSSPDVPLLPQSGYIRPYAAPNGNPWPNESGYLAGYPVVYGQGGNRLYIDNVRNSSDVYAELTQDGQTQPLRHFFIQERGYIILDKLDAGAYTIRYRQLDAGEELLSEHVQIGGKNQEATIYLQRGKAPE